MQLTERTGFGHGSKAEQRVFQLLKTVVPKPFIVLPHQPTALFGKGIKASFSSSDEWRWKTMNVDFTVALETENSSYLYLMCIEFDGYTKASSVGSRLCMLPSEISLDDATTAQSRRYKFGLKLSAMYSLGYPIKIINDDVAHTRRSMQTLLYDMAMEGYQISPEPQREPYVELAKHIMQQAKEDLSPSVVEFNKEGQVRYVGHR